MPKYKPSPIVTFDTPSLISGSAIILYKSVHTFYLLSSSAWSCLDSYFIFSVIISFAVLFEDRWEVQVLSVQKYKQRLELQVLQK
jgi:hypothetical protein